MISINSIYGFYQTLFSQFPSGNGEFLMTYDAIQDLLKTVSFYNTVNITQTFARDGEPYITVKAGKDKNMFELTFVESGEIVHYQDIPTAVKAIEEMLNADPVL